MRKSMLLIRVDKIGDLVLNLNVDQAVPEKEFETTWLINESLTWISDASTVKRNVHGINPKFSWLNFFRLYKWVRKLKPEAAVVFYAPNWIHTVCWLARVPVRGGRLSRLPSFLFLNRGLRQKRSKSEKHESDYNLDLIRHALGYPIIDPGPLKLKALKPSLDSSPAEMEHLISKRISFVVVHAGMYGSALNWPTDNYLELCKKISEKHIVVLTGTEGDRQILTRLREFLAEEIEQKKVVDLSEQLSGPALIYLLSHAAVVVAPSTGVVHLSASLGRPTIGLYSPIKEHLARRWGPKGDKVIVFEPAKPTASMAEIKVAEVANMVERFAQ